MWAAFSLAPLAADAIPTRQVSGGLSCASERSGEHPNSNPPHQSNGQKRSARTKGRA